MSLLIGLLNIIGNRVQGARVIEGKPPIWVEYIVARAVDFSLPAYDSMQENIVADTDHLASVQLYDSDNELTANLRPCLSTEKGHYLEGCLYDVVKKKFYYSQNADVKYGDIVREVEYIESTGTQHIINTTNQFINADFDFIMSRASVSCVAEINGQSLSIVNNGRFRITNHSQSSYSNLAVVGVLYKTHFNRTNFILNNSKYSVPQNEINNITLFAYASLSSHSNVKLLSFKVRNLSDIYILDGMPCILSDGTVCMWDWISGEAKKNAGTGEFVAGKDVNDLFNIVEKEGVFLNRTTGDGLNVKDKSLAHITSMKGNTLVWNQMINNGDFKNAMSGFGFDNATIHRVEEGLQIIQGSATYGGFLYVNFNYTDHKYYISTVCRSDENNPVSCGISFLYYSSTANNPYSYNSSDTAFKKCSTVGYLNKDNVNRIVLRVGNSTTAGKNAFGIFKTFVCIDLTKIFGAGNEPATAEEFEAMFPADYYDYDAGSLLNVNAGGMKSTNVEKTKWNSLYFVDDVHTLSSLTGKAEGSSVSEVIFPEGMKRINNVYDELTDVKDGCFTKAVKRIEVVDLGSLNWRGTTSNKVYASSNITGIKNNRIHGDIQANILTLRYDNSPVVVYSQEINDRQITINAGSLPQVVIRDDRYSNTTEFTESVQGVILIYELNTPIVYTLDTPVPCNYKVWKGGSEIVTPENTEALTAPVDMSVKYIVEEDE